MDEYEEDFESMLEAEPLPRQLTADALREPLEALQLGPVVTLDESATVREAVDLLKRHHTSAIAITRNGRLSGIFTERDLVTRVIDPTRSWTDLAIAAHMTRNPECLRAHQEIWLVLNLMHNGGYRHVPVVDDHGRPTDIVSVRDVVSYLAAFFPEEVLNLPPDPTAEPRSRYGG